LRRRGVLRLNNEPPALDRDKVADGGEVWCHLAQEVAECAHCSRESQLLFKTKGACRFRE
jgi:hypothetical protein